MRVTEIRPILLLTFPFFSCIGSNNQNRKQDSAEFHPNYDEYISYARWNDWSPINPIEKFLDVIESFEMDIEYVFHNVSKLRQEQVQIVVNMKHHEMLYLIEVLKRPLHDAKKSCRREINIMPLLFKSIEIMNRVTFRVMKDVLKLGVSRVVTRQKAEKIAASTMYKPLKIVLKLIVEVLTTPSKYAHLKVDANERYVVQNKLKLNVLDLAAQYQLRSLIPLFLIMNVSKENSLKLAIENGDDIIVKELLNKDDVISDEIITCAMNLGYGRIASRLKHNNDDINNCTDNDQMMLDEDPINEFLPIISDGSSDKHDDYDDDFQDGNGGYSKVYADIKRHNHRVCDVDRINLMDIEGELSMFDFYVNLNKPLMISLKNTEILRSLRSMFSSQKLKSNRNVRVEASIVPYGNHYGYELHEMIPREYIGDVMKPYTQKIKENFVTDDLETFTVDFTNGSIDNKKFQEIEVPQYIFGTTELVGMEKIQNALSLSSISNTFDYLLNALGNSSNTAWQQYIGPIFSGAPFHSHGPALNLLIFGVKQWGLLPPANGIFSSIPPLEELKAQSVGFYEAEAKIYEGVCYVHQHAGEIMFVPRHFSHQTINIAEAVGIAIEVMK